MANTKITNSKLFNLGGSTSATQLPVMTFAERDAIGLSTTFNVDYLVVAGGGGGARSAFTTSGASGGGGGAGEFLYKTAQTLTFGGSGYTVTVGNGGDAGVSGVSATNGGNSVFIDTTLGGGYGGTSNSSTYSPGASGGSGGGSGFNGPTVYAGGSSTATSPGLGNAGGASTSASSAYGAGGGGGAGTAGSNGTSITGGNGGTGVQNQITGIATFYAGGGGGGSFNSNNVGSGGSGVGGNANARAAGSPGTANTGSGGGGGSYSGSAHTNGGSGGSGVVILRYATADIASYTATGLTPTKTTVGTDTILSFTDVGTGTVGFTPASKPSVGETIFNSDTDKVEYFDGTKWYGITYEPPAPVPVGGSWDPANSITSACAAGSSTLSFSNNNRLATESGSGFYVAAFSTIKVGDFWFYGTDAGGLQTQFEGNFDAADQIYVPTSPGTYMEIKWLRADLTLGITKTRTCPFTATWNSNTIRWLSWTGAIIRYDDTSITSPPLAINDILGILIDVDGNTVKLYRNNVLYATLAL